MKKEIKRTRKRDGITRKWRQELRLQGSRDMNIMTCTLKKEESRKKKGEIMKNDEDIMKKEGAIMKKKGE